MKIYTKTGDQGQTALIGGIRVSKDDLRIRTYGGIDELNSWLGFTSSMGDCPEGLRKRLTRIQNELFNLGSELATPRSQECPSELLQELHVQALEKEIDTMEADLPKLRNFILPGGSQVAAQLHIARAVCRRAERDLSSLHRAEPLRGEVLRYVNRLSDYIFVCARWANLQLKIQDVLWSR